MENNEEKTEGNEFPPKQISDSEAPSEDQPEEAAPPSEAPGETAEDEAEAASQAPPDAPETLAATDGSDDESETAEIAEEAAREGSPEEPLPEPDRSLPEPHAEAAAMPEGAEVGEEQAEEASEKKPKARPVIKKIAGLPNEEDAEMRWYVIHAHSGHENKVRQTLESRAKQEHVEHLVAQIIVPTEEVAEVKGGKKRITSRKIFPGYVLIEMKLTHKTWYLIRNTSGVTGFIGSGKIPTPLEPEEVESIFEQMRGEQKKPKPKVSFEKDEKVKIIEGPFTNFMGYVDEVNPERGKLKVMVEIFERLTPVELEFWQVEKA